MLMAHAKSCLMEDDRVLRKLARAVVMACWQTIFIQYLGSDFTPDLKVQLDVVAGKR